MRHQHCCMPSVKHILCAATLSLAAALPAAAQEFKLGVVTFLSGQAAGPFGIPAKNAAEITVDAINAGALPAPYNKKGIAGMPVKMILVDENGGPSKQVTEYRNLVERDKADAVIGYVSSGDCLAIAPVADELKKLTILFDCGAPRVFEEKDYKYVFRTRPHGAMDNVAAARYVADILPNVKKVNGINQNYAWGQDSWEDFTKSMAKLKPGVEVGTSQMPKLGAGTYSSEISALLLNDAQLVHSSFWGADLESFIQQAKARGLYDKQLLVLTAGEPSMFRLANEIPDGAVIGARGPFGVFAPDNALNRWFRDAYQKKFDSPPSYASYVMSQAILGLKAAAEKAMAKNPKPSGEDIVTALEKLEFEAPSGTVKMSLAKGHQAVQENAIGRFKLQGGKATIVDVKRYPPECVNPPEGTTAAKWIEAGFPGAKC
ncbi:MAG: ABC transporter substrate-binding protein [Betaproteobacteria bacterium]|nr:MAG: ABC transporter substrate-binding protein [Betaproteobacteria bacterium]